MLVFEPHLDQDALKGVGFGLTREPDPDKIAVIDWLATPTNATGIAQLLERVGWYRELIQDFAKIADA